MGVSRLPILFVLVLCVSLGACQPQVAPATAVPPSPTLAAPTAPAAVSLLLATSAPTAAPPPTAAPSPTPPATTAPTATSPSTATTAPSPVPPTATVVPTLQPASTAVPTPSPRTASAGNLRQGPGTNYAVVGGVKAGDTLELLGRNEAGDWLLVKAGSGEAWMAAFLLEGAPAAGLPVRQSTAPTVTPPPAPPTAAPQPPAAGPAPAPGQVHVPAPYDLKIETVGLQWNWDGPAQVKGLDWYFDVRSYSGEVWKNPPQLLMANAVNPGDVTFETGWWTWPVKPEKYSPAVMSICWAGSCTFSGGGYVIIQIAVRDASGKFTGWISDPSQPFVVK